MDAVLYIHGMGGDAEEAEHYSRLFPDCRVSGLNYTGDTPWDAGEEIRCAVSGLRSEYGRVILIANSIGAYYSMCSGIDDAVSHAYFISPVVDMERLIYDMMASAGVTLSELRERGTVRTESGDVLSWKYLSYVTEHPINWSVPTDILYGSEDMLTSADTIASFAKKHGASLTVMENGEHWFHTESEMRFLDKWIFEKSNEAQKKG